MRTLAALMLACAPAALAGEIETVPALSEPVAAERPVIAQLRLDLAALQAPSELPASAVAPAAAQVESLRPALDAAPRAARAGAPSDALRRIALARKVLDRFEPGKFAELSQGEQEKVLGGLWEGWRREGLLAPEAGPDPGAALDRLILQGVEDKALTSAGKSVFLGVGVLGYPLQDAVWLARTSIASAIEESTLRYPEGQRWVVGGTPQFLGTSKEAQDLVDAWGAAVTYGRQIVAQARAGSRQLPASDAASPSAAAAYARLASELLARGDEAALAYLGGQDPTLTAFLLDARKPGYYLYNGDREIVERILATDAVRAMGVRRVEHVEDPSLKSAMTYVYRPGRVAERLRSLTTAPAGAEAYLRELAAYGERVGPLAARLAAPTAPDADYSFVEPEYLPGSALDSDRNRLSAYAAGARSAGTRYDLPLTAGALRSLIAERREHPSVAGERWRSLVLLFKTAPALSRAEPSAGLRLVSQEWQTHGRLVARSSSGGALLQLAALDHIAELRRAGKRRELASFLRFLSAALAGSTASPARPS